MDRQQTGNLLIGAGILAGLGTFAYWYLSGGAEGGAAAPDEQMAPRPAALPSDTYVAWTGAAASSSYATPGSVSDRRSQRGY